MLEMDYPEKLCKLLENHSEIVFFGGAGVSTESGIPDFRSVDGLYHQQYRYPPETILSHSFFLQKPEEFFRFYWKKMIAPDAKPNKGHMALAELERMGKLKAVITQNIDGLHQDAGSRNVLELHGSVRRNYCTRCGRKYSLRDLEEQGKTDGIPLCSCGGIIKPDVVLYEEALDDETVSRAIRAIGNADLLIIGGTSLTVYPAAGFLNYFRGDALVVMNRDATNRDAEADLVIRTPVGETLGAAVDLLKAKSV